MNSFQNMPLDIEAKVTSLKQHRQSIEAPSQGSERLEQEITQYSVSAAPIRRCPVEILLEIFQLYLAENPRLIRRLMLVSKSWHQNIVNNPGLWTYIPVIVNTFVPTAQAVVDSIIPRIDACFQYSGSSMLRVELVLGSWMDADAFLPHHLDLQVPSIHDGPLLMENCGDGQWKPVHVKRVLECLVGQHGERMERWASAKLFFPGDWEDDRRRLVLSHLIGATPHLTALEFASRYFKQDPEKPIFPVLSSLKTLTIYATFLLDSLSINAIEIEHLTCPCMGRSLMLLIPFISLQTLKLLGITYRRDSDIDNPSLETLRLPSLQRISFEGATARIARVRIDAPLLWHVEFIRDGRDDIMQLPDLNPKTVSWFIYQGSRRKWTEQDKRFALQEILVTYRSLKEITVAQSDRATLMALIKEANQLGILPPAFRTVHIVEDRHWTRVVEVFRDVVA